MKTSEKKLIRKWVNTWRKAGPLLEKFRRQELREFDYAENWRIVDAILGSTTLQTRHPCRSNGMVIMQSYFMKWRKQQGKKAAKGRCA